MSIDEGGGARTAQDRALGFATYQALPPQVRPKSPRWRHNDAQLTFEDLIWTTGRVSIPAARAAGMAHLGPVLLDPGVPLGDPRITVLNLADARRLHPDRVAEVLGQIVPAKSDRFAALTVAFQNCGAYVEIPDHVVLEEPIQLAWIGRPGPANAVFPQIIVRIGRGAKATIIERHAGEVEALVCGTVEVDVADGGELDYVVDQRTDGGSRVFFRRAARCGASAQMRWHVSELGGAYVRSFLGLDLVGTGAIGNVNALCFARGFANADLAVVARHAADATRSRTVVRSAVADRGAIRWSGDLDAIAGVVDADAGMRADGLLLSRNGFLELTPALGIATNRIAASHGVTIGSLDEERLFYAQSRGIARAEAERMMAMAFFEPAVAGFPSDTLREEVRTALEAGLDEVKDTFTS
jgi:Fe-S cluster assembly protein SufD